MSDGAIDVALEQFALLGPEFGPGLSNHGPMAAEALVSLGRADVVEDWAEWYAARLDERPRGGHPIAPDEWRTALGDMTRVTDWAQYFEHELDVRAWRDVLDTWVARLAPGIMAGATHGILRTAHAVRSLHRDENPLRVRELANGLAYWAARYQELPGGGAAAIDAGSRVGDALGRVALIPAGTSRRGLIFDVVRQIDEVEFAPVIDYVDMAVEVDAFVGDVTRTFVRQYLANADRASIAFVHTVTAPSALRFLAPHLTPSTVRETMRYAWQACAAIYAAYGGGDVPVISEADGDRDDLTDRAVAARDEHAIKFTEACLREHALSGDVAFLIAAEDAVTRLRSS
jgi:hypothetical protein